MEQRETLGEHVCALVLHGAAIVAAVAVASLAAAIGHEWHEAIGDALGWWGAHVRALFGEVLMPFGRPFATNPFVLDYFVAGTALAVIAFVNLRQAHARYGMFGAEAWRDLFSPSALFAYAALLALWPVVLWFWFYLIPRGYDEDRPPRIGWMILLPVVYFAVLFGLHVALAA